MAYAAAAIALFALAYFLIKPTRYKRGRVGEAQAAYPIDREAAVSHLCAALRCRTISLRGSEPAAAEFDKLHALLREAYPNIHDKFQRTELGYTLIYHWQVDSDKLPIMLMGHQDVVPAEDEADWQHPPFSGVVADGCIWGRGAIDMKNMLIAELEALEYLAAGGFEPDRDIYLLMGHDEEILGMNGAREAAEYLRRQGVRFEYILDEGSSFSSLAHYGIGDMLAANIDLYEKGYVDLHLAARRDSGHSSTPPRSTALSDIAHAITKVERDVQFKSGITDIYRQRLACILPFTQYATRFTGSYPLLFGERYINLIKDSPAELAMVRSTRAATMISGSDAPNILPDAAEAVFNFRLNPDDTVEQLQRRVKDALSGKVEQHYPLAHNASVPSSTHSRAYRLISDAILDTFDNVITTPSAFAACTDSRHVADLADDVYRFIPFMSNYEYRAGMHGTDERIAVDDFIRGISFFIRLIKTSCGE